MSSRIQTALLGSIAALLATQLLLRALPSVQAQPVPTVHEVLRARTIELVAADGRVVGQLHTADDGSANLRLRDGRGEVRVKLGATSDGAGLILMDGRTEPALWLEASARDTALTLAAAGRAPRVLRP